MKRAGTIPLLSVALQGLGMAQAPASPEPPSAFPNLKWSGSLWASAVAHDRETGDGSRFLRPLDPGNDTFAFDGAILGLDATLGKGWSVRATLVGGHLGRTINLVSGDTGSVAVTEGHLIWTGAKDAVRMGRMNAFLGMEVPDASLDFTASRGLLYTYSNYFGLVGVSWRHTFSPSWSSDVLLFNGEDRVTDNNRSKTFGLGLTYNHGGAPDRFVNLQVYRGAEQDGRGAAAQPGAEGRPRERIATMGQWVWGRTTLQWEATYGREAMPVGALAGATGEETVSWSGAGAILSVAFSDHWSGFARGEVFKDPDGVRLAYDTTVAGAYGFTSNADLQAVSATLGAQYTAGPAFTRLELRNDRMNHDVADRDGTSFRSGQSLVLCVGTRF